MEQLKNTGQNQPPLCEYRVSGEDNSFKLYRKLNIEEYKYYDVCEVFEGARWILLTENADQGLLYRMIDDLLSIAKNFRDFTANSKKSNDTV